MTKRSATLPVEDVVMREAICNHLQLVWESTSMTQQTFARLLGVAPQTLSNYFAHYRTPPHAVIWRVCEIYGLNPGDFYPPISTRPKSPLPAPATRGVRAK